MRRTHSAGTKNGKKKNAQKNRSYAIPGESFVREQRRQKKQKAGKKKRRLKRQYTKLEIRSANRDYQLYERDKQSERSPLLVRLSSMRMWTFLTDT